MEAAPDPNFLFKTRTNTELGAESVEVDGDGSVLLRGVVKLVTESMLTSYPRALLGHWTPNRASIRFSADEIADRRITKAGSSDPLDLDALRAAS